MNIVRTRWKGGGGGCAVGHIVDAGWSRQGMERDNRLCESVFE